MDNLTEELQIMFDEGKYTNCIDLVTDKIRSLNPEPSRLRGNLLYIQSISQGYLGNMESGLEIADLCDNIANALDDNYLRIKALLAKAINLYYLGKTKECTELISELETLFSIGNYESNFDYFIVKGNFYNFWALLESNVDLKKSTEIHKTALKCRRKSKNKNGIGSSLANIGNNYNNLGLLHEAISYYLQALEIFRELKNYRHCGGILNNIGNTVQKQGLLQEALDYYEQSLEVVTHPLDLGMVNHNIGIVLHQIGDYDEAMRYTIEGYKIRKEIHNPMVLTHSLIGLIHISLDSGIGGPKFVEKYLQEFKELTRVTDEISVEVRYKYIQALILKNKDDLKSKLKALELIEEVLFMDQFNDSQITIQALVYQCELYLLELQATRNTDLLVKIRDLVSKLKILGTQENLYSLLVESGILDAKLAILQNNVNEAQKILGEALILAEKFNLGVLKRRILEERKFIKETIASWLASNTEETNLNQRMDEIGILKPKTKLNQFIISPNRLAILIALTQQEGLSFGDLKSITGFSATKLSKQLKKLIERNYISKRELFIDTKPTKTYFISPETITELNQYKEYIENYAEIPLLLRNYIYFN